MNRGRVNFTVFKLLLILAFFAGKLEVAAGIHSNASFLPGIRLPDFNSVTGSSNSGCSFKQSNRAQNEEDSSLKPPVKLHLKHRSENQETKPEVRESLIESKARDFTRIKTLHTRILEKKNQNKDSRLNKLAPAASPEVFSGQLTATLESGVSLGSGEYFMDVFIGTPPKHFSLILDTGSDLNWIQCEPCHECFEQNGPHYDPQESTSYHNISCHDPRCDLVSSPDPPRPCKEGQDRTCPYFYWYGDSSNTTGDFAAEKFTVNLTTPAGASEFREVENVMFGCGHWNRGLFHGAAGLLGLGRGPLSFSSQLQSIYGHSFSYCLVDRNSNASVSSKLVFGEDKELLKNPNLNFTSFVSTGKDKENSVDTFYYVQIKSVLVGGETVEIPEETWRLTKEGGGGTIIDSGTTLSYFADPAYSAIKEAFVKKMKKNYTIVHDFPILEPCYNVSGVDRLELPEFAIVFGDGAVWNFPAENYFIRLEPEEVVCLAILGTPKSALSIIGNYQQQNFHVLYDTNKSRLGFAPSRCADV